MLSTFWTYGSAWMACRKLVTLLRGPTVLMLPATSLYLPETLSPASGV